MISFVKSRPPLVVFFLCILTSAVTFFCFAFYIKTTEFVPDSDRNHEWIALLKQFNSLDVCLESDGNAPEEVTDNDFIEISTVQTLVRVNSTEFIRKFTSVKGFLSLDGWHANCPKNYNTKPSHLHIQFDVPDTANATEFDACVTIRGPEEYLPKFSEPNCRASSRIEGKEREAFLSSVLRTKNKDFCKNGVSTELTFYPQNKTRFANFLSDKEKSLIYVRLLWTSYFLLFILLIIVTYGILQSDYIFDKYIQKFAPHK